MPRTCKTCGIHIPVGTTVLSHHVMPTKEKPEHGYEYECPRCAMPKMRG